MQPEGSSPRSQDPATCPHLGQNEFNPHSPIIFIEDPFQYYPPIYA